MGVGGGDGGGGGVRPPPPRWWVWRPPRPPPPPPPVPSRGTDQRGRRSRRDACPEQRKSFLRTEVRYIKKNVLGFRIRMFLGLPDPDPLVRGKIVFEIMLANKMLGQNFCKKLNF
jgi:hypothetical protein